MSSPGTVHPGAQALMFSYRIRVGHPLRANRTSQLRIQSDRHFDEIRLFLDPGELVAGIADQADRLSTNLGLSTSDLTSGELRTIQPVTWHVQPGAPGAGAGRFAGVTLALPAGTEIGLSTGAAPPQPALRLRFPADTAIEVGGRETTPQARHAMRGMSPVLLDGIPLLELSQPQHASLELDWSDTRTAVVNILGIVSPFLRRGEDAVYHVMEAVGDKVVGGASIQVRA